MIALCIGRKEQGKTTLAYHLIMSMPQRVVFDPKQKFRTTDIINEDVYDSLNRGEPEVIVYAGEYTGTNFERASFDVSDWAKDNPEKKFGFLVDEVGLALENGLPEKFHSLIKVTPQDSARIVMTTWRAVEVPPIIRSQVDHWFIFKTTEPRDLEVIEERCGEETATLVQKLPPYHFVHCDDSHAERRVDVFTRAEVWNVDTKVFNESNRKRLEIVA